MYYELYIDVFFTVNFMMDCILLLLTRKMLKCSVTHGRVCLGALLGAALTCLIVILPISNTYIAFILFHGFINIVMLKTGLGIGWNRDMIKAGILLYISGFLVGGVFQFLQQYIRSGSLFFLLAVISYYVVSGIMNLVSYLTRQNQYRCQVILIKGDRKAKAEALIDTGNSLKDAVTGLPVSIIDRSVARELVGEGEDAGMRYIPYHSIGKKEGVMPMVRLDGMYVCRKKKLWVERPLVAVCDDKLTADRYRMILNPDVLVGGIDYDYKSSSTASI